MLAILRRRSFALLWAGGLISMLGDWLLFIALPFYIYDLTGSTLATGGMFIAQSLPILLFGSLGGVIADRWDRRRTMIIADLLRAGLILLLLVVRSPEWLWALYLVVFVESSVAQFFSPAKNALLPHLVEESQLMSANALNTLSTELTRLIGAPLGGALMAVQGLGSVVVLDSASYLISAALIGLVAVPRAQRELPPSLAPEAPRSVFDVLVRDLLDGLRLVVRERWLSGLFMAMATMMLGQGVTNALLVPFVEQVMHGDAQLFGWIITAQGIGGLAGGLLIGRIGRRFTPAHILTVSACLLGIAIFVIVNLPLFWLVMTLLALVGLPVVAFMVSESTLLQTGVADEFRGRVFGTYGMVQALMMLIGLGVASLLGDRLGIVPILDIVAGLYVLAGLIVLVMLGSYRAPLLERPQMRGEP